MLSGSGKMLSGPGRRDLAAPPYGPTQATRSPAAKPEPSGALADDAGEVDAEDERGLRLELVLALAQQQVGEGDPDGVDVDEDLRPKAPSSAGSSMSLTSMAGGPSSRVTWAARMARTLLGRGRRG